MRRLGDPLPTGQKRTVGDCGWRRADLLKLIDALTVRFSRSLVYRAVASLRHDEQPTRVIDEECLGVVWSIRIAEVVRVVGHRQTVGPRVCEEVDPNEVPVAVVVADIGDV